MSKLPSVETQLRTVKQENNRVKAQLKELSHQRDLYMKSANVAEAAVKEWKERFDALLRIYPIDGKKG